MIKAIIFFGCLVILLVVTFVLTTYRLKELFPRLLARRVNLKSIQVKIKRIERKRSKNERLRKAKLIIDMSEILGKKRIAYTNDDFLVSHFEKLGFTVKNLSANKGLYNYEISVPDLPNEKINV